MNPSPKRGFDEDSDNLDGKKRMKCNRRQGEHLEGGRGRRYEVSDSIDNLESHHISAIEVSVKSKERSHSFNNHTHIEDIGSQNCKENRKITEIDNAELESGADLVDSSLKKYIASCFETFSKNFDGKLEVVNDNISILKKEMRETKDICNGILMAASSSRTTNAKNGRYVVNRKGIDELVNFGACFNSVIFNKVLRGVVVRYIASHCNKTSRQCHPRLDIDNFLARNGAKALSGVLFGKRANQSKLVWKGGVGLEASKLRKTLVVSAMLNVQRNRFNQFLSSDLEAESSSSVASSCNAEMEDKNESEGNMRKIREPKWLVNMTVDLVEEVRRCKESKKNSYVRGVGVRANEKESINISDSQEGCAAEKLFSEVTNILHDARSKGRTVLFEELGYFLTKWEIPRSYSSGSLEAPVLRWAHSDETYRHENMAQVPLCKMGTDSYHTKSNELTYKEFSSHCKGLILSVTHGVRILFDSKIKKGGSQKATDSSFEVHDEEVIGKKSYSEKNIHRIVNLLDVALNFLSAFCGFSTKSNLGDRLGINEDMIRSSYLVAIVLKEIVRRYMCERNVKDISILEEDKWSEEVRFESVSLSDLKPSPSAQSKAFQKMVIGISQETYEVHHVSEAETVNHYDHDKNEINEEEEVEEDDEGNIEFVLL